MSKAVSNNLFLSVYSINSFSVNSITIFKAASNFFSLVAVFIISKSSSYNKNTNYYIV